MKKSAGKKSTHSKRRKIPESVRRAVLIEAGYRCAVPTCHTILILDLHHLVPVRDGGSNTANNLLALCPTCHALFERGAMPEEALRTYKTMLVSLNAAFDRDTIDCLLFLFEVAGETGHLILTGDGVGRYISLFASGLAKYSWAYSRRNGFIQQDFNVSMTERGLRLLAAWKQGNAEAVQKALSMPPASGGEQ